MTDIGKILRNQAREQNVPLWVVEKDYVLSYLLAGIANTPGLGDQIVLKGGTALKKVYFPDYRFSEDLDFSSLEIETQLDFDELMQDAIQRTENGMQEQGFFQVQYERLVLREPHPGGQAAFTIRVQFPYHRQPMCRVKVEISIDEPALLGPENRSILHTYPESFAVKVQAYSLAEILAEKLRALLQSHAHLQARGWGASRVCRDYYDIWQLLGRKNFAEAGIPNLTEQKCAVKGIDVPEVKQFFHPTLLEVATREWDQMLILFVPDRPSPEQVFTEAQQGILKLWQASDTASAQPGKNR